MTTTLVSVNTYTHSVAYVTNQVLLSIKRIISWSGLDVSRFVADWREFENGIKTWLGSRHLETVVLEIFDPPTNALAVRWDFEIRYTSGSGDDGGFWADSEAIKNAIKKCGLIPSECSYRVVVTTKPEAPSVAGWTTTTLRSTDGLVRYCVGTTIDASSLASGAAYWKRP